MGGGGRPSAELSGHDQQMGGQGERSKRDSWSDGRETKLSWMREGEMQNRGMETGQHFKENER